MLLKYLKKEKFIILSLITLLFNAKTFLGQDYTPPESANVIKPSPNVAALCKYVEIPVNHFTGTPNISIPIWSVRQNSVGFDLSISYHAAGFKLDEEASNIGLGWSLNCGGVISRMVKGMPDDYGGVGFIDYDPIPTASEIDSWPLELNAGSPGTSFLPLASNNELDTETDNYAYNFMGHGGRFILGQDKQPILVPYEPINIEMVNNGLIEITDETGKLFIFNNSEFTTTGSYNEIGMEDKFTAYRSALYLSKIVSTDKADTIYFEYEGDNETTSSTIHYTEIIGPPVNPPGGSNTSYHDYNPSQSYTKINTIRLSEVKYKFGRIEFLYSSRKDLNLSKLDRINIFSKKLNEGTYELIKSILFNTGYFSYNLGKPIDDNDWRQHRLKLESIEELTSNGHVEKKHSFEYSTIMLPPKESLSQDLWGHYNGQDGNITLIPEQTVYYQGQQYNVGSANRNSDSIYMKACILKKIFYPTGGTVSLNYEPHKYLGLAENQVDEIVKSANAIGNGDIPANNEVKIVEFEAGLTVAGSLTVTISPYNFTDVNTPPRALIENLSTGETEIFTADPDNGYYTNRTFWLHEGDSYRLTAEAYDNNNVSSEIKLTWSEHPPSEAVEITGGGLRIKSIYRTGSNGKTIVNSYKYGKNECSYGELAFPPFLMALRSEEILFSVGYTPPPPSGGCDKVSGFRRRYSAHSMYNMSTVSGSSVLYPQVTEYKGTVESNSGKSIYNYTVHPDEVYPVIKEYKDGIFQIHKGWKNGLLKGVTHYKFDNDEFIPVTKTSYNYGEFKTSSENYLLVQENSSHSGCRILTKADFNYFEYPSFSGAMRKTEEWEITYNDDATDSIVNIKTMIYDDPVSLLPTEIIGNDSKGQTVVNKVWYPNQYKSLSPFDQLYSKNILSLPVRMEKTVNGNLVAAKFNNYNTDGKITDVYIYESDQLIASPGNMSSIPPSSDYKLKVEFEYDNVSKTLNEFKPVDNLTTSFVWGYNSTMPIVKGMSINKETLQTVVEEIAGTDDLELFWSSFGYLLTNEQKTSWRNFNQALQDHQSLANAMVTTYLYRTPFGLAAETDPNGKTTYYEYDDFGRLKVLKDDEGNILKAYNYNYRD